MVYIASDGHIPMDQIDLIKRFIESGKMDHIENGRHDIDGTDLYVNVFEYDTNKPQDCIWEAHRDYYDLHYIISGKEIVQVGDVKDELVKSYDKEKDFVALSCESHSEIRLKRGDMLFLGLEDAHKTGVMCNNESVHVRKGVFKIRVK